MNTFFYTLKRTIIFCLILVTLTVFSYTDSLFTPKPLAPEPAYAGGFGAGLSLEITQMANRLELASIFGTTNATAVAAAGSFALDQQENYRNFVLNGIAWTLAKQTLSSMVSSIIDWVNSGFEGRPAFVQDLQGFLVDVMDQVAGDFINYVVGGDSFVCSPFRLDIAASLNARYMASRRGEISGCTLSDMVGNVEDFLAGNFSSGGGWEQWIRLTANPVNTPFGAYLTADTEINIRLVNAAGKELEIIRWGQGFLSTQVCETIYSDGPARQRCMTSTPGTIINDQLSEALGSSYGTLIEADQWNELVSALFGQLAQKAITGVNGLLGLSAGSGYTYSGYSGGSLLAEMQAEAAANSTQNAEELVEERLDASLEMITLATAQRIRIEDRITDLSINLSSRQTAQRTLNDEIIPAISKATADRTALTTYQSQLVVAGITEERRQQIIREVIALRTFTPTEVADARRRWAQLLR